MSLPKKFQNILITLVLLSITLFSVSSPIFAASPEQELEEIQRRLEEIRRQKQTLNQQIASEQTIQNQYAAELNKLKNEINLLNTDIAETELEIQELNLQITLLNDTITKTEDDIVVAEEEIDELQEETDQRLVDMYMDHKTFNEIDMIFASSATNLIKLDLYQSSIQEETNKMLDILKIKKVELDEKRTQLEKDKLQVERDQVQVEEEKLALERQRSTISAQEAIYYRKKQESLSKIGDSRDLLSILTEEEKYALAEQTRLEQVIFDRYNQVPNGTFVSKGTMIGLQGCTGYCTGPHLHFAVKVNGGYVNPCSQLKAGSICGGNGPLEWPQRGTFYLTSGYGPRGTGFHYALDLANPVSNAPIYAAHDGYLVRGFESCNSANPLCKNGGANYVIICENKTNCNSGFKTMYWHLAS